MPPDPAAVILDPGASRTTPGTPESFPGPPEPPSSQEARMGQGEALGFLYLLSMVLGGF